MPRGAYQHRVRFDAPGLPVPDGDGGYTQGFTPLDPPEWFASIRPATARDLEQVAGGTVVGTATHIVECDYHGGVTVLSRVVKLDELRMFTVDGVRNHDERDVTMSLFCREQL